MANHALGDIVVLNGKTWPKDEFVSFARNQLDHQKPESWWRDLYSFYVEWFGTGEEIIVHTSGSTGLPKNIRFKKSQLLASARQTGNYFRLDEMSNCLLCLPVGFIAGKMMIVRALAYGLNLIAVKPGSDPLAHLQQKINFAAMTPHQVFHSLGSGRDLSQIETLIIGGGQISPVLLGKLQALPTACYATYGMAETLTHIAVKRISGPNPQNYFNCLPGIKIEQDGRGCLIISADYLSEKIVTNDVVESISEKEFAWLGRIDNVINTGGIKIFPEKIEVELSGLLKGNFFVSSTPDPVLGEKVILIIEGKEPSAQEKSTLIDHLKNSLPHYHCPKEVYYFPKFVFTSSGKINRVKSGPGLTKQDGP